MSWYSQMFKSHEAARERNRREQRRFELDLNQSHGIEFIARYRIEEVNKQQRLIEKELERIRQGIHKKPAHDDIGLQLRSDSSGGGVSQPLTQRSSFLTVVSPRIPHLAHAHHNTGTIRSPKKVLEPVHHHTPRAPESPQDATALYKAIVYLQTHPLALEPLLNPGHSSTPKDTINTPRKTHEHSAESRMSKDTLDAHERFVPGYLRTAGKPKTPERYRKYSSLLRQVPSPIHHLKGSPRHRTKQKV